MTTSRKPPPQERSLFDLIKELPTPAPTPSISITSPASSAVPTPQQRPSIKSSTTPPASAARGKSQIRQSQIADLLTKAKKRSYRRYLAGVQLVSARGFENQAVTFDFPVTALIGPNGGGKTTILGAAACAYDKIKPQRFFAKSGKLDDSMRDWKIEYDIVDRDLDPKKSSIRRTASFRQSKWYRDALTRDLRVFGVRRTVPANERAELRKCASARYTYTEENVQKLETGVARAVQRILGKNVEKFQNIRVQKRGQISLLSGHTLDGASYSEFHFGAGESSIIRMIMEIEAAEDECLILIEEIENGLHPLATSRMVEYLIEVAQRKSAQVIFTTHSNDALRMLPDEAVWASVGQVVYHGKLDIQALRAIVGDIDAQLVVFTEDEFSRKWIESAIRQVKPDVLDIVSVYPMSGDGLAVRMHRNHNQDPSITAHSICYLDGDSQQPDSAIDGIYHLPGASPEAYVYDIVQGSLTTEAARLALALHMSHQEEDRVRAVVEEVRSLNRDPHLLFSQVGAKLGYLSEEVVRGAFFATWAHVARPSAEAIVTPILASLPDKPNH